MLHDPAAGVCVVATPVCDFHLREDVRVLQLLRTSHAACGRARCCRLSVASEGPAGGALSCRPSAPASPGSGGGGAASGRVV